MIEQKKRCKRCDMTEVKLINDKTMVPLRFLSENMGYTVTWDEAARTAVIE